MTTPADAIPEGSADTKLVPVGAAPAATAEQLLTRVHAKLSDVDSSVTGALHNFEALCGRMLARVEEIAAKAAGPVGAAASAVAAVAPPPISTIAKEVAALCACGHDALHTKGGCTAPGCTCTTPPAKK
jgi:hypothetical protein